MPTLTERREQRSTKVRAASIVALAVFAALVSILAATRATSEFGNSDEGLNSSVWAMCTRSLRDAPIDSALGGRRIDGVEYANHPPLLCITGAAAEALGGEERWVTRAPAWLASLALIPLTYLLLRRTGFREEVAAGGTLVALGTPMFTVYGPMLDTPVVGLPLAAAVAAGWAGEWRDPAEPWPPGRVAALCLLAGLASWQAGLCALLAGAALLWKGPDRRRSVVYLGPAAAGIALSLGWALWTYGSLVELGDKLTYRSGGSESFAESVAFQFDWARILLGASFLALLACIAALSDREVRPVAGLLLATATTWAVVFHGGAGGHQYWNYFLLLPAAVGAAWVLDGLRRTVDRRDGPVRAAVVVLGVAAGLALLQLSRPNQAERLITEGIATGEILADAPLPSGGEVAVVGDPDRVYAITTYYLAADPVGIVDARELEDLARTRPSAPVLVVRPCAEGPAGELCRALTDDPAAPSELAAADEVVAGLRSG